MGYQIVPSDDIAKDDTGLGISYTADGTKIFVATRTDLQIARENLINLLLTKKGEIIMATRGLYKFYSTEKEYKDKKSTATIYRHWDNYLEAGGLDLKEFLETLRDSDFDSRFTDSSYLASKFVVYLAREFANNWNDEPLDFLSVGIVDNRADLDMWQEFTYHIIGEIQDNGLPKVVVDFYDETGKDLFEALNEL